MGIKQILQIVLVAAVIVGGIIIYLIIANWHAKNKGIGDIDITKNVIAERKSIQKLGVLKANYEVIQDTIVRRPRKLELTIAAKVYLEIGIDLDGWDTNAISISKDTIHVLLPEPTVLLNICNPTDAHITVLYKIGNENKLMDLQNELIEKSKLQAIVFAHEHGLFELAKQKAKQIFSFLYSVIQRTTIVYFKPQMEINSHE